MVEDRISALGLRFAWAGGFSFADGIASDNQQQT